MFAEQVTTRFGHAFAEVGKQCAGDYCKPPSAGVAKGTFVILSDSEGSIFCLSWRYWKKREADPSFLRMTRIHVCRTGDDTLRSCFRGGRQTMCRRLLQAALCGRRKRYFCHLE